MPRSWSFLALPFALAGLPVVPAATGTAVPTEWRLVGETADGATVAVPLSRLPVASLAELGVLLLEVRSAGDAAPSGRVDGGDLASATLATGERVSGQVVGGAGETLSLRLFGDVVLPVDVGALESLVFEARIPEGRTDPVEAPEEFDRLYLRVGDALDTLDGTLEEFTPEGVRFVSRRVGPRLVPWSEVAALFVEVLGEPAQEASQSGAPVVVDLADGSRLRGRMQRLSSEGLDMLVGGATAIRIPLDVLAEIAPADGSVVFLSELEPDAVSGFGNPFASNQVAPARADVLGMTWPPRADRAVTGGLLRAGGRVWRRGLGVQAPTTVSFALEPGWRELRGAVAIDDAVLLEPAHGSVVFRIRLDGEVVWESRSLSAGDAPVAFPPIELAGKRTLTLEADMDADLNQGDRADWLRMMLVG